MSDLNAFIRNLYQEPTKVAAVEDLEAPTELEKIFYKRASLSVIGCADDSWLQQFQGTPLYASAIALQEQELSMESQDLQQRMKREAEAAPQAQYWLQRDALRLQKQQLALELHKINASTPAGPPAEEMPVASPVAEEAVAAPKVAKEMSEKEEKAVKDHTNHFARWGGTPAQIGAMIQGGPGAALGGAIGGALANRSISGALAGAAGGFGGGAVGTAIGQALDHAILNQHALTRGMGSFMGRGIGASLGAQASLRGAHEMSSKERTLSAAMQEKKAGNKLSSLLNAAAEKGWQQYPKANKDFSKTVKPKI